MMTNDDVIVTLGYVVGEVVVGFVNWFSLKGDRGGVGKMTVGDVRGLFTLVMSILSVFLHIFVVVT